MKYFYTKTCIFMGVFLMGVLEGLNPKTLRAQAAQWKNSSEAQALMERHYHERKSLQEFYNQKASLLGARYAQELSKSIEEKKELTTDYPAELRKLEELRAKELEALRNKQDQQRRDLFVTSQESPNQDSIEIKESSVGRVPALNRRNRSNFGSTSGPSSTPVELDGSEVPKEIEFPVRKK